MSVAAAVLVLPVTVLEIVSATGAPADAPVEQAAAGGDTVYPGGKLPPTIIEPTITDTAAAPETGTPFVEFDAKYTL